MLFGDASMEWVMPVLAVFGTAVTGYFAYRTTVAKLQFDGERVKLVSNVEWLNEKVKVCEDSRAVLEAWNGRQQAEINDLKRRLDDASRQHSAYTDRRQHDDPSYVGPERRVAGPDTPTA